MRWLLWVFLALITHDSSLNCSAQPFTLNAPDFRAATWAAGSAAPISPGFKTEGHSAVDGSGTNFNFSLISVTVAGANPLLVAVQHSEFGEHYTWNATYNGLKGRLFVITNGYAGGAGNERLRMYYWTNPPAGAHNLVVWQDDGIGGINSMDNELAVSVMLFTNVAQVYYPFRDVQADVSTSNRTGDGLTVNSIATDLVVHIMASSMGTNGTLGAGETQISSAQAGTVIANILVSTKVAGASTTTVTSTNWAGGFPLNGLAFSLMTAGTAETTTFFIDDFTRSNESPLSKSGAWTSPIGNVTVTKFDLVSNAVKGNTGNENMAMVNAPSFPVSQRARMTYLAGSVFDGPCVRMQGPGSGGCYSLTLNGSASDLAIQKITDNGLILSYPSALASVTPARNLIAGDTLEIVATGTASTRLDCYWNGVWIMTATDSSSPFTSGQPGLRSFGSGNVSTGFEASSLPVRIP